MKLPQKSNRKYKIPAEPNKIKATLKSRKLEKTNSRILHKFKQKFLDYRANLGLKIRKTQKSQCATARRYATAIRRDTPPWWPPTANAPDPSAPSAEVLIKRHKKSDVGF